MKKRLLIALLCLLLAVSACGKTEIRPTADEPAAEDEVQTLSFETTDLNGSAVSSEELFSSLLLSAYNLGYYCSGTNNEISLFWHRLSWESVTCTAPFLRVILA